jgi:hypothetical protein
MTCPYFHTSSILFLIAHRLRIIIIVFTVFPGFVLKTTLGQDGDRQSNNLTQFEAAQETKANIKGWRKNYSRQ